MVGRHRMPWKVFGKQALVEKEKILMGKIWEGKNEIIYKFFIDFERAFDSINKSVIYTGVTEKG